MQNITQEKIETWVKEGNLDALCQLGDELLKSTGKQGRTLLQLAAHVGQAHIVSYLLKKGLNPYRKDNAGCTPYNYAKEAAVQALFPKPTYPIAISAPHLVQSPHKKVSIVPKTNHRLLPILLLFLVGCGLGLALKSGLDYNMPPVSINEVPILEQTPTTQEHELLKFEKNLQANTDSTKNSKKPIGFNYSISLLYFKPFIIGVIALAFCGTFIVLIPQVIVTTELFLNWITHLSRRLFIRSLIASVIAISGVLGYFVVQGTVTEWISKGKTNYKQGSLRGLKKGAGYLLNIKEPKSKKKKSWWKFFKSTPKT